jgi:hypothetical protein
MDFRGHLREGPFKQGVGVRQNGGIVRGVVSLVGHGEPGAEAGAGPLWRLRPLGRVAAAVAGRH